MEGRERERNGRGGGREGKGRYLLLSDFLVTPMVAVRSVNHRQSVA